MASTKESKIAIADEDIENVLPISDAYQAKASSTLDTKALKEVHGQGLTKVRKRAVPLPRISLPPQCPIEEFHIPSYVTSLPTSGPTPNSSKYSSMTPSLPPHLPPFTTHLPPPFWDSVTAIVEQPGYISFRLRHNMVLDISANMAIRLTNLLGVSSICFSSCTTQVAIEHPMGRMLQYGNRLEVQCEDMISVKNAKVFPRGISFTANNMALVYLLDEAGARSTSDMFHDLYATPITEMLFAESCKKQVDGVTNSIRTLDKAQYWKTNDNIDCWLLGPIFIQQKKDGLVIVEREAVNDNKVVLKSSPSNGKIKLESPSIHITASIGMESHMFLRTADKRLHYNGINTVFTVRNAGHSAGFDEKGCLRIF